MITASRISACAARELAIRGEDIDSFERAVDTHVKNIRRKIEADPRKPCYVLTVYGVGYKFTDL